MRQLLLAILLFSMDASANQQEEEEAARIAIEAALKQSGIDTMVQNFVRQYVSKDMEEKLGKVLGPVKVVVDRKVSVKWEF